MTKEEIKTRKKQMLKFLSRSRTIKEMQSGLRISRQRAFQVVKELGAKKIKQETRYVVLDNNENL